VHRLRKQGRPSALSLCVMWPYNFRHEILQTKPLACALNRHAVVRPECYTQLRSGAQCFSRTVQSVSYKSKALGTNRKMVVYTPPGYEQSKERYPVLYLLHGAGSR
jgi:enterochelin esterase-like enzyme